MKKLLLALALIFLPSFAWAQCTGVFPPNTLCGNLSGSPRPPAAFASGGTVVGPGSSTVNDIAVWNNTSGTLLKDVPFVTLCGSNIFSSILNGCVPSSGGGTSKFLRADGTWVGPDSVQVTYTPQGTGGVATTVASELNRTIWVNDYGAVCNGVTDDHVAFQNAINEGQSLGLPVRFSGACAITTGLSITTSVDFGGVSSPQSRIIVGSAGAVGITITTPNTVPVYLHDFGMLYASAANAGVAAITVTGTSSNENSGSRFERLVLNGNLNIGIDFVKASTWTLTNSTLVASNIAVRVANGNNGDSGDSTIYGNLLQAGSGGSAVNWLSSGGLRIENNKILGSNMAAGVNIQLANGVATSDIFVIGNSIEGLATTGISVSMSRSGTTGGLNHVIISNNELGGGQVCVSVPTDPNGIWLIDLNIHGNTCITTNTTTVFGFIVNTTSNIIVMNNTLNNAGIAASATPESIGTGTATNCVVGYNPKQGTWGASSTSSCTTVAPI